MLKALRSPTIAEDVFDQLQDAVFVKLDTHPQFYAKFKKQEAYVQLLADFDLLLGEETGSLRGGKTDPDGISINSLESRDSGERA